MDSETYYNYTDAGKLFGLFEIRNAIESVVLGLPVLGLCTALLPFTITWKIIVTLCLLVPTVGFALIGLKDDSLTRYLKTWWTWRRRRARKLPHVRYLAQGTIYPDVIESGGGKGGKAATIKSHHNVGGLPDNMSFAGVVEPLRGLFKDEVRALGRQLGLPAAFVNRQPFPGPGLGVRVVGEITEEKLAILREADAIFRAEIVRRHIRADQYFAVLTDTRSVGVVGDFRTYGYTVALRAVRTSDFMTCVYVPISHTTLSAVATRIVNEVPGAGRVVYDITGKPPATVEWE